MGYNRRRQDRGFSIIELMIVVSIIGLISSLAIPNYLKFTARSRRAEMLETVSKMKLHFKNTYDNSGSYATPNSAPSGTQSSINPDPAIAVGLPAPWDSHRAGWLDLPFPPEGGVRMRYTYIFDASSVTIDVCGSFPGLGPNVSTTCPAPLLGNYHYREVMFPNGSSDVTEFPAF